ncbi:hypothetical protein PUN4_280185 [Paraburkholderia unamae]|nr:hypothetical protein PUN4_280185 [Paraburkholderia unamae]
MSALLEERRIKWRYSFHTCVVTVDRRQTATACSFDSAIRLAKIAAEEGGVSPQACGLKAHAKDKN